MTPFTTPDLRARLSRLPRPVLWIMAARVKTLSLSVMPVLAGSWLGAEAGDWHTDVTLAAMLAAMAIQVGTNLWNDAADAARGVDRDDRLGPPRMTALGLLDGADVRKGALAAFIVAAVAGMYLAQVGGWPVIAIGTVSLALGYLYSLGPVPISGLPVGEALVIAFFGVVAVSGTAWLQGAGPVAPRTLVTGLMIGFPAAAVLMLNNHRDRAQDARAGRRTLAIVIGPAASRITYCAFLLLALVIATWLAPSRWLAVPGALALSLGYSIWTWPISARLNGLLARTAAFQVLLTLSVLLA